MKQNETRYVDETKLGGERRGVWESSPAVSAIAFQKKAFYGDYFVLLSSFMDSLSVKLDSRLSKAVDRIVRIKHYSTKTEFVRETIRKSVLEFEEEEKKNRLLDALVKYRGILKGKGRFKTDEEFFAWRRGDGAKEMEEYFDKKLGINQK